MPSFDVVSEVSVQEVDNALNQTRKEIAVRYDFRGTKTELIWDGKSKSPMTLIADDEVKMRALIDIVRSRLAKRGVDPRAFHVGKIEPAHGRLLRSESTLVTGIPSEEAKEIVKKVKESKLKVQAAIQDEKVRISGKSRDDLQTVMQMLRDLALKVPLQFSNFRE